MLCPACQTAVPDESLFCPKCGQRLRDSAPVSAATPMEKLKGRGASPDEPEQKLWAGGFSPKAMIGYWLLALVLTLAGIAAAIFFGPSTDPNAAWMLVAIGAGTLWIVLIFYYLYLRYGMSYELTSQRLIHKVGLFSQTTNRIEVIDVDDVSFHQSFIERLLGVGTIRILSSDTSDPMLVIRGIDEVKRISNMIDNVRRDERRRRGMYIETV